MKSCLLALFVVLWALPGVCQSLDDPFDARVLTDPEKRHVQAALAWAGTYHGLLDGAWGKGSQSALEAHLSHLPPSAIRYGDLRGLLRRFASELRTGGWEVIALEDPDFSYVLPLGLLEVETGDVHVTATTPDRRLLVRGMAETVDKTLAQHRWLVDNHAGPGALYRSWKPDRLITSAILSGEKTAYLISYPHTGFFGSTLVQFTPAQAGRAKVIIASFTTGRQSLPRLPEGGLLERLFVARPSAPAAPRPEPSRPVTRPDTSARAKGNGTGFFVNATDIVTAAHVVDGCVVLRLDDGTPLTLLLTDTDLDLAVLSAGRRSSSYLPLNARTSRLGEPVFALGYPYRGLFGQGLTVTGGNISALPAPEDPTRQLMISAPVQPGNSGGPVLNRQGEVIGVVVSRASDMGVLGQTGSLPQNMNFAVSLEALAGFLRRANILYPQGTSETEDIRDGVPQRIQDAVVSVDCY